jgi:hypothetical protein
MGWLIWTVSRVDATFVVYYVTLGLLTFSGVVQFIKAAWSIVQRGEMGARPLLGQRRRQRR